MRDGQAREAAIVFSDIRGCSEVSDALSIRDYADFLVTHHRAAERAFKIVFTDAGYGEQDVEFSVRGDESCLIIHRYTDEDVAAAIRYAVVLKLLWLRTPHNVRKLEKAVPPVQLGLGIHIGTVYHGIFRSGATATSEGYAINLAKRIESESRHGKSSLIMLSEAAIQRLDPSVGIETRSHEPVELKGISGSFVLREIVDVDDALVRATKLPAAEFPQPFLDQLRNICDVRRDVGWLPVLLRLAHAVAEDEDAHFLRRLHEQWARSYNDHHWQNLARAALSGADRVGAVLYARKALAAATPDSGTYAESLRLLGEAYEASSQPEAALRAYRDAVVRRPSELQFHKPLILFYIRAGRAKKALDYLAELRSYFSSADASPTLNFLTAACHAALGKKKETARLLRLVDSGQHGLDLTTQKEFPELFARCAIPEVKRVLQAIEQRGNAQRESVKSKPATQRAVASRHEKSRGRG